MTKTFVAFVPSKKRNIYKILVYSMIPTHLMNTYINKKNNNCGKTFKLKIDQKNKILLHIMEKNIVKPTIWSYK